VTILSLFERESYFSRQTRKIGFTICLTNDDLIPVHKTLWEDQSRQSIGPSSRFRKKTPRASRSGGGKGIRRKMGRDFQNPILILKIIPKRYILLGERSSDVV
jgi:hypothetical protein